MVVSNCWSTGPNSVKKISILVGWLVGGFICLKHIEGPTYPHLGKVGQLVNIQWYSFMPLLVVLLAFVFFCIPSFISVAVLQTGMLHPPDAGRGASPRVFHFVFLLFMCWFFLFVLFSSFVFLHSWLGWVTYIFTFIVLEEG